MSQIKWTNSAGGDFATAGNWSTGTVPGPGDDAIFMLAGPYTVTSSASETVHSVQIVQGVTLAVNAGTFDASSGSGSGTIAGLIAVANNAEFQAGGTLAGTGTVQINSGGNATYLTVLDAGLTLSGGGKVVLSDNSQNYIRALNAGDKLTNVNDTISGSGQFGYNNMSFTNGAAGILNANAAANALVINAGTGTISNAGLIEATGSAGLDIANSSITQTSTGVIKAAGVGNNVRLDNGSITGGTLTTTGGGQIQVTSSNGSVTNVTVSANSTVAVENNSYLFAAGTLTNKGKIALQSGGNGTRLEVNSATLTLTGAGAVTLTDNSQNFIYAAGSGDLLVNVNNTISGAGQLTYNDLAFDNQAAGVINATGTSNALVIDNGGGVAFTNEGLLEDTGAGGLSITDNAIIGNKGTILASGASSHVDLYTGSIQGGVLKTVGGGVIQSTNNFGLDGSTAKYGAINIASGSQIAALNDEYITLSGSIVNAGTIALDSSGNGTRLQINGTVTLSGAGAVTLSDNSQNFLYSVNQTDTLVNVNNTISGSGQLGTNDLVIDNQAAGVINSTGGTGLSIDNGGHAFTNEGLIEDTGTGGLALVDNTVIGNSGTILASGAGSHVDLYTGSIEGGTLKTIGGGVFQAENIFGLDGSTTTYGAINITANSQVAVLNDEYLTLSGSIVNGGTIALDSSGNGTRLQINGTVNLSGGGTVLLSDNTQNYLYAVNQTDTLVNVDNTITGSGQLGINLLAITNDVGGKIVSTGSQGITVDTGGKAFTNQGLIEDTGAGGFTLVDGTVIANSGTIEAFGAGSSVDVSVGTIEGGTVATSNGGVINVTDVGVFDGKTLGALTLAAGAQVAVANDEYLTLVGTIVNNGTIGLDSVGNGTRLQVNGTVTLTGAGSVVLSDSTQNYLYSVNQDDLLVNVNNTISGSGQLGINFLAIDNQAAGIINSNGAAGMTVDTGGQAFTNEGLVEDTGTGGFAIVDGTVIGNKGTILAAGAGSHIDLNTGSIQGGVLKTTGGGVFQSVNNFGLDGSTAKYGAINIASGSQIAVLNSEYLTLTGSIVNGGTIALDSAGNGTRLQINGTVTLSGGGSVLLSDSGQNYLYSVNQTDKLVNVNNTISGSGQLGYNDLAIDNQAAGIINSTGASGISFDTGHKLISNEGLIEATGAGGLTISDSNLTNTGTIAAMSDSVVTIASDVTFSNYASGTLTGGTYEAIAASGTHTATLNIDTGPITSDQATIVLSGAGASITNSGTALDTTLAGVGVHGTLEVLNGNDFVGTAKLTDGGTILLTGTLADASLSMTGTGVVNASGGAGTLSIHGAILDKGIIEASNGGSLLIGSGSLNNQGTVQALAGSTVTVGSGAKIVNLSAGTLTGGVWSAIGSGATLALGEKLAVDAADLTLSGAGSAITGLAGKALAGSLTSVVQGAQLNVLSGAVFTSLATGGLTDSGTITLGGGTFGGNALTIASTGSLVGAGAFKTTVTDNGLVDSRVVSGAATLTVTGAISGTGSILAETGSTLAAQAGFSVASVNVQSGATLQGTGTATGAISVLGTLSLAGSGSLTGQTITTGAAGVISGIGTVATSVANSGTIQATGGTLTLAKGETGGVLQAVAVGTQGGALVSLAAVSATSLTIDKTSSFTGFGSVSGAASDAGSLVASGSLSLGSLSGAGHATIDAGTTLSVGGALTVAGVSFAAGSETLALGQPSTATSVLSGFTNGDTIDLVNTGATFLNYNTTADRLLVENKGAVVAMLNFSGSYTTANFALQSDGHGGTDIVYVAGNAMADLHHAAAGVSQEAFAPAAATAGSHAAPAPAVWAAAAQPGVGEHLAVLLSHHS